MDIPVWTGTSNFSVGATPFGFYDNDPQFRSDADKVAKFCAIRLGYPLMAIELQSGSFYTAFEEATTVYGNEIYQYKVRENYFQMEGNGTSVMYNDNLIVPSLGSTIRIAENYGTEAGSGGNTPYYTGSLRLVADRQEYDLNQWASASASLSAGDSIEIKRIFYEQPPAIVRFFDPYAGTGTGYQSLIDSFGFGAQSPGINFMLMPIYFDLEKLQAIEFNDQIRRSGYSFELHNNKLRLFPIPRYDGSLLFQYIKKSERNSPIKGDNLNNPNIITDYSKVPYANPVYDKINSIGKQWILQYTLAIAKEMLGYIRSKYSSVPIPNSEVTLNGPQLVEAGKTEKDALLAQLRDTLDETSRKAQLTKQKEEAEAIKDTLNFAPMTIYIG